MSFLLHKTCLLSIQILSNTPSCGTVAMLGFFLVIIDLRNSDYN